MSMGAERIETVEDYLNAYSENNLPASTILTVFQSHLPLEGEFLTSTYRIDNSRLPSTLHLGLLPVVPTDPYTGRTKPSVTVSKGNHLEDRVVHIKERKESRNLVLSA